MFSHSPAGYDCPFCRLARGAETSRSSQDDVIWRDEDVTGFISAGWWPRNKGHVLIVPNQHFENIYELPPELGTPIQYLAQRVALAFKELYGCDGVSTRQHNEPSGNQDVWHYHLHVFPRYAGDNLYISRRQDSSREERLPYARKLREWLKNQHMIGF
jgi:histidine triad (HIT) family protein